MSAARANGNAPGSVSNGDAPNSVVIPPNSMFFPNHKMEGHGMVDVSTRSSKIVAMNSKYVDHLVLKPARSGIPEGLAAAYNVIRRDDAYKFTSQVLKIYTSNLHHTLIPTFASIDASDPSALRAAHSGLESIRGLVFFLQQCVDITPMKKQPVIAHLREHFLPCIPGIFSWLIFFLKRNPARYLSTATTSSHGVLHACHILDCALLLEDDDISQAIRTSHEVAELMVTIWLTKNRDLEYADPTLELRHPTEYVVYPVDELGRCPVTSMMSLIMFHPTSRATFIHVWCNSLQVKQRTSYDPVTLMTRTILSRLYQIEVSILEASCKPHSSWGALKPLLDILQAFLDSSLPLPTSTAPRRRYAPPTPLEKQFKLALLASLRKERFVLQFTHVLHLLSDYGLADERTRNFQYAPQTFIAVPLDVIRFFTSILLQPFFSESSGILTHFAEMLTGGILQISANCAIVLKNYRSHELLSLERGTFYGQLASELPRMCHTMAIFPPVLKAMARVFERRAGDEKGLSGEQRDALNWAVERYDGLTTKADGRLSGYRYPWFDEIVRVIKEWDEEYHKIRHYPTEFFKDTLGGGLSCFAARHLQCPVKSYQIQLCGGCRTASYCSEWCQQDDWGRHKHECGPSRALRRESLLADSFYHPTWRQFHIWRINMEYTDHGGYVEHNRLDGPHEYIGRVNFCKDVAVWTFVEHEDYEFAVLEPDDAPSPDGRALTDGAGPSPTTTSTSAKAKALAKSKSKSKNPKSHEEDPDHRYLASYQYNARFAEYLEWAAGLPEVDDEKEYWKDTESGGLAEKDAQGEANADGGEEGEGGEAKGEEQEGKLERIRVRMATFRRLIEGVFPFGDKVIILTIKYKITKSIFGEDTKREIVQLNVLESLVRVVPHANVLLNGPEQGQSGSSHSGRHAHRQL